MRTFFPLGKISYGEGIVKREVAGFLGQGRQSERKKQRQHAQLAQHKRLPFGFSNEN